MKRNRKAKILATLGPASSSSEVIENIFKAGCDVFRLNFSHGSIENHRQNLESIRNLNKKIIFLNHVKINLDIKNIDLMHERIEDFNDEIGFDTIICRSYASLSKIYLNSKKHLKDGGIIIAMKGKEPYQELKELKEVDKNICFNVEALYVPRLAAERHAIIIYKN